MQMKSKMTAVTSLALALIVMTGTLVGAETNSYFRQGVSIPRLEDVDFKMQRRISTDPIADNQVWGDQIRSELTKDLQGNGFERNHGDRADFLVAFYVGLKEKYDVRFMDYGYPGFWGPRRFGWAWGWPNNMDVWRVPYTESTLIVDIIDGQTNQLIWRGYDTNTIDMKQPDKRLDKAVDNLVKKFLKDREERS